MHIKIQFDVLLWRKQFHVFIFHKIENYEFACTRHKIANFIVWVNWMCVNASTAHVDGSTSCSKCRVRTRLDSQSAGAYVHQIVLNDRWCSYITVKSHNPPTFLAKTTPNWPGYRKNALKDEDWERWNPIDWSRRPASPPDTPPNSLRSLLPKGSTKKLPSL